MAGPSAGQVAVALLIFLTGGGVAWGIMVWLFARGLLRPPRMTDAKALRVLGRLTPEDMGMPYERREWVVRDERGGELKIAGWSVRAAGGKSSKTVVMVHGFADAKVGVIAWGPVWRELGYNLVAVDLRGHGESGGGVCTAGYYERHDLGQVIDRVRAEEPDRAREVVLFGVSLGASVAAAAAVGRDDVAAVVMDSPHAEYREAVRVHAKLLGLAWWVAGAGVRAAEWMSGARFGEVGPGVTVGNVGCPVLVIGGEGDPFFTAEVRERLGRWATVKVFEGAGHLMAYVADADGYRGAIADFLAGGISATDGARMGTDERREHEFTRMDTKSHE